MANEANLAPAQLAQLRLVRAYRAARRDFIAAAQGADAIARVHPGSGPDGKPLFCDSAAFGPRHAAAAVIVIGGADGALTALLKDGVRLPEGTRLVAIDSLDPFARAWGRASEDWPAATLATIAAEDLSDARKLILLDLDGGVPETLLKAALAQAPNQVKISYRAVRPEHIRQAFSAAIAAL